MILTSFTSFLCQDGHVGVGDVYCERHIAWLVDSRWIQEGEALHLPIDPGRSASSRVYLLTDSCVRNISWSKITDVEATNKSYLCFLHFKTQSWHKSHIRQRNNYSYTCVRIVVLTSKWRMMPKGIWNGHCFLTLITPVLQEHIKHEHIPHFCCTTWTKSYIMGQESLDAR